MGLMWDGDGDQDVMYGGTGDGILAWYQNDGSGSFGPRIVITTDIALGMNGCPSGGSRLGRRPRISGYESD